MKPGRELDVLVAEHVMGWTRRDSHVAPEQLLPGVGVRPGDNRYAGPWYWHPNMDWPSGHMNGHEIPEYSTDIKAAWDVMEKLLQYGFCLEHAGDKWHVNLLTKPSGTGEIDATGESAPHAICLAALKAVGYSE